MKRREFLGRFLLQSQLLVAARSPLTLIHEGFWRGTRTIKIIGVGGAAITILDRMKQSGGATEVGFVDIDADPGRLDTSLCELKVFLNLENSGFYEGGDPRINERAAARNAHALRQAFRGIEFGLIVAALGGGTGTGASPVVARILKDSRARVVAVVTLPFAFEGKRRRALAEDGLVGISREVDELLIYRNQTTDAMVSNRLGVADAWRKSDDLVSILVRERLVAEILRRPHTQILWRGN